MRGLLNKLTEQNINGVSSELADLLGSGGGGSRALCMSLAQSMLSSCASEAQLLAPLVLLHAALARALSIRLGQNVVTALVEATVSTFEKAEKKAAERRAAEEASEHARSNCALLLAHLYNFGALHVSLMYELVRKLVAAFGESELQMLIIILRAVGSQLRADDPGALKEIILDVQSKSSAQAAVAEVDAMASTSAEASGQSARARVFLSMLNDLKNNKQKARDLGVADGALPRLRKWLKTLGSAAGAHEPAAFKVGWEELVHANSRGRWWVIGSAWAGRSGGGGSAEASDGRRGKGSSATGEERLLALADTQRMNTDIRRKIFVSIMGADDFVDAHGRLTRLRLTKAQQPEIVRVLLECCGQEGIFNRYYALLASRLCESHREIRFGMTFAFWDVFKQLPELTLHRAANTAKLLAQLLAAGSVPVTCLKVVHWSNPSQRTIFFWQVFFVELLASPHGVVKTACSPLLDAANAETRDGVLLFLERHLRRTIVKQHPALAGALKKLVAGLDSSVGSASIN